MSSVILTRKPEISQRVAAVLEQFRQEGEAGFIRALHREILAYKVKFPLLEYAATCLHAALPAERLREITDRMVAMDEIGGYVIAGIFLQRELPQALHRSMENAVRYILQGDKWYVCDIIGERVQGHGLLTRPEEMLPLLQQYAQHPQPWIVRSVGVAGHYAIKKKLDRRYAEELFCLLLTLSGSRDFHVKKSIGWAAKTAVKFHPFLAEKYRRQIEDPKTGQWFRTKIRTGLGRSFQYAQ